MAIISENEQVTTKAQIPSDAPAEEQDLAKKINELLSRSKRHRKRYDGDWHYNYEFVVSGRQWPQDRPRWRFSEVVNMTWANIMTEIAIQTDARPKFEFSTEETGDEAFIDVLKQINDRNWDKYKWASVVQDELFDCKLYHVGHAEVSWDPDLEQGLGDVCFRPLDPFYCFWDPRASDVNKGRKARHFLYTEPVPTSELKLRFPDKKDRIKSDVAGIGNRPDQAVATQGRIYTGFDPAIVSRLPSSATGQGEVYGGEPHTVLVRCWLRDDTLEEICEEKDAADPTTGEAQKEYILRKKYPKGRYIEMANNVILRDGPPGVEIKGDWVEYDDDRFPIVKFVNYAYPREYAGENEVTHTKGPQKINNMIWSSILDQFKMMGNPITVLGDSSNVDEDELTNESGSVIHATDINQVRREPGLPISPGAFDLLATGKSAFNDVQGLQDVARGADTTNVNSALMMEGYVEAAQTRPRMKNRTLDHSLQDVGELILMRMLQFYTQPRVFRLTNKEGYPEEIEFYIPTIEGKDGKTYRVAKIIKKSTLGDGQKVNTTVEVPVKGVPDVRVVSGSALPFGKAQKSSSALTYFNAGAIDNQELLKATDWPNYEQVLKRMAEKAQANAEAQAQQGAK